VIGHRQHAHQQVSESAPHGVSLAAPAMVRSAEARSSMLLGAARGVERRLLGRPGWQRVLRNAVVGFVLQAGTRMAAALSYYALVAAGPMLVLTIGLGGLLLGVDTTRQIVASALPH